MSGIGTSNGSPELKKPELEEGEEETFAKECLAYRIACEAEPETKKKLRLYLPMPMIKEKKLLKEIHDVGARKASEFLEKGKNLVFLTIGDPTVYSTGIYIYKRLKKMGYQGEIIFPGFRLFVLRQQGWRSRLWRTGRSCMFFRCPMELKKS